MSVKDTKNMLFQDMVVMVSAGLHTLPDKPEETPDNTLRALWHAAAYVPVSIQKVESLPLPDLDASGVSRLQILVEKRLSGVPLAHLTGRQQFMGLELLAGKEALIPRLETELLAQGAIKVLQNIIVAQGEVQAIDVCTGCGNLALALAFHVPRARVFGADLSGEAVALARRNAHHLGLADRVEFRVGDLFAPFEEIDFHGRVDLLVCNPPYISSKKVDTMPPEIVGYEPRLAFDGGPLGIRIVERLMREAPRFLRKGGVLAFEVGLGQGPALVKRLANNMNYKDPHVLKDANGDIRAILAET